MDTPLPSSASPPPSSTMPFSSTHLIDLDNVSESMSENRTILFVDRENSISLNKTNEPSGPSLASLPWLQNFNVTLHALLLLVVLVLNSVICFVMKQMPLFSMDLFAVHIFIGDIFLGILVFLSQLIGKILIFVWELDEGNWYSSHLDPPPPPWVWTLADWNRRTGSMLAIVDVLFAACLPLLNTIVRTRQIQVTVYSL